MPVGGGDFVAFDLAKTLGQCLARDNELALDLADRGGQLLAARDQIASVTGIAVTGLQRGAGDKLLAFQLLLQADQLAAQAFGEPLQLAELPPAFIEFPAVDADEAVERTHLRLPRT